MRECQRVDQLCWLTATRALVRTWVEGHQRKDLFLSFRTMCDIGTLRGTGPHH